MPAFLQTHSLLSHGIRLENSTLNLNKMHHEEEERYHERHNRPQHRDERSWHEEQTFRNRWEEPQPFMHDRERRDYEESRAQREWEHRQHRPPQAEEINRRQHGFSDDHRGADRQEEQRQWRHSPGHFTPENQHARDRWQQQENLPPLREQRHRRQSRRDEDWDNRGW
ncbi:hypothetical protein [Pontibacter roseus]|uniref:hypothetical protein n=1 Tax=Pontibacter roseus TaxID=336989 RepID=UPI00035F026B|nr:hypothetical protein [Pontibacter roseus]